MAERMGLLMALIMEINMGLLTVDEMACQMAEKDLQLVDNDI